MYLTCKVENRGESRAIGVESRGGGEGIKAKDGSAEVGAEYRPEES
jgi:hypothetical protein